jgi:ATP-binding protein involved in chromosome partitioning
MKLTEQAVLDALKHVDDPDLKKDLVSLGMIRNIAIDNNQLRFSVFLTTPACPMKEHIEMACRNAIQHFIGPDIQLQIEMTAEVTGHSKIAETLPGIKNTIAIASGKGGVGKSTVAAGLAAVLAESGAKVGILDADIYGPSIPLLFGVEDALVEMDLVERKELMRPIDANGIKLFSIGFLSKPNEAIVWRGPMVSSAIKQFMHGVNWGALDYLIIDLPPGTGDVQLTLVQNLPLSGAVIVSTPQKLAVADASRACSMFELPAVNVPILGLVENMAFFTPNDQPDKQYYLFGEGGKNQLLEQHQISLLGSLPIQTQDQSEKSIYTSKNVKFFTEIAGNLVRSLAINNKV